MRYLVYSLFSLIVISNLFSCTDSKDKTKEGIQQVTLMKADWNDTTAIGKIINAFYKDSVLKQGEIFLEVRDGARRGATPYHYLQLHKIYRPNFKIVSPTVGYMPVLMLSGEDSAIVDFQITWQQINPEDSLGQFVVTDRFLQSIKNEPRYEWIQEEKYWIRKNIEVSEERKQQEQQQQQIQKDYRAKRAK